MIGAKTIDFSAKDFIRGMSSTDFIEDGGFSPLTQGVNLTLAQGLIYAPADYTDASTNVTGSVIASCEDPLTSGADRVFLDNEGTYYSFNGTTMTAARTDVVNAYVQGKTDMAAYSGAVFATSDATIVKWVVDSSFNATYASFSNNNVPHPVLVFEDNIYYGDKNLLLRQNGVSGAPATILTLPTSQTIVALGIDPGTGRMLISITEGLNLSDTLFRTNRVAYYDGFSNKALKVVIVDDMITAFCPVGGIMYIGYGRNLGYWTGAGIQFLRKIDIDFVSTDLLYKQHFTNSGRTLYFIEGNRIIAHGDIIGDGNKVFYPVFENFGLSDFTHISNIGSSTTSPKLGYFYATDKFRILPLASSTGIGIAGGCVLYTNDYNFDRPVTFNQAIIEYGTDIPTDGNQYGILRLIDSSNQTITIGDSTLFTNTTAGIREVEGPYPSIKTRKIQLRYTFVQNTPIKRITIFYNEED